jgi:hypothetical protein
MGYVKLVLPVSCSIIKMHGRSYDDKSRQVPTRSPSALNRWGHLCTANSCHNRSKRLECDLYWHVDNSSRYDIGIYPSV